MLKTLATIQVVTAMITIIRIRSFKERVLRVNRTVASGAPTTLSTEVAMFRVKSSGVRESLTVFTVTSSRVSSVVGTVFIVTSGKNNFLATLIVPVDRARAECINKTVTSTYVFVGVRNSLLSRRRLAETKVEEIKLVKRASRKTLVTPYNRGSVFSAPSEIQSRKWQHSRNSMLNRLMVIFISMGTYSRSAVRALKDTALNRSLSMPSKGYSKSSAIWVKVIVAVVMAISRGAICRRVLLTVKSKLSMGVLAVAVKLV